MNKIKKIKIIHIVLIITTFVVSMPHTSSQDTKNEFSIFGGVGLATFIMDPSLENVLPIGFIGDIGLGYTFFLNPQWGIHLGAGLGLSRLTAKADNLTIFNPGLTDSNGYLFDLHTHLYDFTTLKKSKTCDHWVY